MTRLTPHHALMLALTISLWSGCDREQEHTDMGDVLAEDMASDSVDMRPTEDRETPDQGIQDLEDSGGEDGTQEQPPLQIAWKDGVESFELATMSPLEVSLDSSSMSGVLDVSWSLRSRSAPDLECDALLRDTTSTTAEIYLPANADVRCADELDLHVEVIDEAQSAELTASIKVVPSGNRVLSFEPAGQNPQPELSICPDWDCLNHSDPTPGRLPNGDLAIWAAVGGDRGDGFPVVGRFVGSVDGGWQRDALPVMEPMAGEEDRWDRGRETPSVRWNEEQGAWDMWYLGYQVGYHVDPAIGQSRSLDAQGTMWSNPSEPIYRPAAGAWDETFLTSPGALLGSDGVWRLYFAGASTKTDAIGRIGVLTSMDGESWTPYEANPVFEGEAGQWDANILDPHVQFVGGRYVMWYSALAGQFSQDDPPPISVGVAVSEDGYVWERLQATPLLSPEPESWTSSRVLDVEVLVEEDGSLLMVGYGISKTPPNPDFPDFLPGRIGFWRATLPAQ